MEIQAIKNRFSIVGNAPTLNHALHTAIQVANTELTVLIIGESGVGKEIFSQIIHSLSVRKHQPFIAVNCGAIPEGTIDSELFGHEKGSFTGALDNRKGYFETVNGGTIFLDEIGEMPLGTQARLLRMLETGEFIRVGSSKVQKADVRVIAATNKELLEHCQKGAFRQDLYYRLSTVPIRVPSLRERQQDIPLLFRKFVNDFASKYHTQPIQLSEGAIQLLCTYPFLGNVRELKNIADQISVLTNTEIITEKELKQFLPDNQPNWMLAHHSQHEETTSFSSEREILYKLFFDMQKDVAELKKMIFNITHQSALQSDIDIHTQETAMPVVGSRMMPNFSAISSTPLLKDVAKNVIISPNTIHTHEEVDESLNLMEKEKETIIKALKKYKNKRKKAAIDLGISERSLYRRIKELNISI